MLVNDVPLRRFDRARHRRLGMIANDTMSGASQLTQETRDAE